MPQVIAAIGAAITAIGATAASATIATAAAAGLSLTTAVAIGNVVAAVATGAAALFGASGFAAAVNAWGTVALLASTALRPSGVGRGAAGTQVDFQADPRAGIPLILGRSGTGGKAVHANTSGQFNKNLTAFYLLALSAGPIEAVESLSANEFPCTFGPNNSITSPPQYVGSMLVSYTPGAKPDPVAYYPPGVQPGWIPEWTDAHKLSGVACAWWTLVYDVKSYPTGMPRPLFVVRGPAVYDPRKDSTYPGGSGPQRPNDEATWSFVGNDNPYLQALSWLLGRRDNGLLTFGVGAPIEAIDVPAFADGANVATANGWAVGGEVLSSDRKWDVLRTILQAGGGEPVKLGGRLSCVVRTPRVVLTTITGRDTIGDVSITGTKRRRDRFNQIIPSYRSEQHGWEMVPAGAVQVPAYVTADGGLRSREGTYLLVQQPKQAAELAAYDILDAREFEPVVLPLGPKFAAFKPGDCIALTEPEFGLNGQPMIVQTREIDPTSGRVTLTLRSETPGKHDYALGRTPNPPPISGLGPLDPAYVARPDAGSWTATGGVLTGADGAQVPAIWIVGGVNDPNVSGVIFEYRLQLSPGVFGSWVSSSFPATVKRAEFRAVISGATYHVQVRYQSVRNVEGALALDLGLVTVGTLISHGVVTIGGQTPQELIDQLNETTELGLETADKAADNAAAIAQNASDILFTQQNLYESTHLPDGTPLETYTVNGFATAAANDAYSVTRVDAMGILLPNGSSFQFSDTTLFAAPGLTWGQYRTSTQSNIAANTAAISTEQTTRANADSALSTRIDQVSATAGGNTAAITAEQTARANADTALATNITNVNTKVDGNTASITTLTTSVNGLNAQYVLAVSSTGPGYARVAGLKLAASPTVSSIAFAADQIGFTNGTDNVYPLAVVGGKVIATNFQADDIKANTITANMIIGGAVTQTSTPADSGQIGNNIGSEMVDQAWSMTSTGGRHIVQVYGELATTSTTAAGTTFRLYCNGVEIGHANIYTPGSWGGNGVSFPVAHVPGAGLCNYQTTHTATPGSGPSRVNRVSSFVTELKK